MKLFDETLYEIKQNKSIKESGKLLAIPFHKLPKLSTVLPGIRKKQYSIVTSNTKEGKTQLSDFLFVHQPLEFLYENPNFGLDLFTKYYSLEIGAKEKMTQFISYRLFSKYGIAINPNNLKSQFENYTLDAEILKILESSEFKDYFQFLEEKVEIIDGIKHTTGIMVDAEGWCRKNGNVIYDKVTWEDGSEHKIIKNYIPNNPDLIFQPIVDHATLLAEKGKTLYECIKTLSSEHFIKLKNTYEASPVLVQQQNAASTTQQFTNRGDTVLEKVKPDIEGLAGCKDTRQDATLMLGIFSPYKYKQSIYEGWDLTKLKDYHREISIMLNRSGRSNIAMQMYFNGANSYFKELPYVDPDEEDPIIYNKQLNAMNKVYSFVEENRQKELSMNI